jgi:hypothetical protein
MQQLLEVIYEVPRYFKIPDHIDLNNESQVEDYEVEYDILTIELTDGATIKIKGTAINNEDLQYPEETDIIEDEDRIKNIMAQYFNYDD